MDLKGSCHCGKVTFTCKSHTPYPYMRCYCHLCRKTAGGGGYSINIMAQADSLVIKGKENTSVYRWDKNKDKQNSEPDLSENYRHFCKNCASFLWAFDPSYPEWIFPFASAIDTELPVPDIVTCIFLESKPKWAAGVDDKAGPKQLHFDKYPNDSIEQTHKKNGWWIQ
ncbi:hypothetical protein HDU89_006873 [Geranomyces variabilis]|nr:hypothetical protein HDU89_006873 [Geranomyces variabilis]